MATAEEEKEERTLKNNWSKITCCDFSSLRNCPTSRKQCVWAAWRACRWRGDSVLKVLMPIEVKWPLKGKQLSPQQWHQNLEVLVKSQNSDHNCLFILRLRKLQSSTDWGDSSGTWSTSMRNWAWIPSTHLVPVVIMCGCNLSTSVGRWWRRCRKENR